MLGAEIEEAISCECAQLALGRRIERGSGINQDQSGRLRCFCECEELLWREDLRGRRLENFIAALEESALEEGGERVTALRQDDRWAMAVARESFRGGYGRLREGLRVRFAIGEA